MFCLLGSARRTYIGLQRGHITHSVSNQIKPPDIKEFILIRLFWFHRTIKEVADSIVHLLHSFPSPHNTHKSPPLWYKRNFKYKWNRGQVESPFKWPGVDIKGFIPQYWALFPHISLPLYRHNGASEWVLMQLIPHEKVSLHQKCGMTRF